MSEMTPEPVSDDDIPTLTDIVVPGRLPVPQGAETAQSYESTAASAWDFVFDIDFDESEQDEQAGQSAANGRAGPDDEAYLPLPWAEPDSAEPEAAEPNVLEPDTLEPDVLEPDAPPEPIEPLERVEQVETRAAPPPEPAVEEVAAAPVDAAIDPQRLQALRARVLERLEQCLHEELALTESRLRDELRSELDTTLAELLGPSSTS